MDYRKLRKLFFVLIILAWIANLQCTESTRQQKPNIVFILADDLGYGDLSCLNAESKISTPNIDRLAEQGLTITDAHSGSAVCTPTRYGILTGRYSWRTELKKGVIRPWEKPLVDAGRLTVGDFLKQHGYTSACIGKWHLGWDWPDAESSDVKKIDFTAAIEEGPVARGFDYYFGDDVPNFPPYCFIENDHTVGIPGQEKPKDMFGRDGPMIEGWELEEVLPAITRKAAAYIRNEEAIFKRNEEKPFFLYFALTAPHTPIAPIDRFEGTSEAGAYGDFVQEVDWAVGQIMKALKAQGIDENTLIIFTSDNGSPARDGTNMSGPTQSVLKYDHDPSWHLRGMKADIWEGGHRIPFIARWPGEIKPNTTSDETICLTDFMATAAAIIGENLPSNAAEDSYNLLPLLKGESYDKPLREATVHHSGGGQFAIRQGKWKLILGGGSGGWTLPRNDREAKEKGLPLIQLYNMNQDVNESNNLYDQHPEVADSLKNLLEQYKKEGRSVPVRNGR